MKTIEAYQLYHGIKLHFSGSYDYHKYHGKIAPGLMTAFADSKDHSVYKKLANHPDPLNFLVANAIRQRDGKLPYIRSLMISNEYHENYLAHIAVREAISRNFKNDIDRLGNDVLLSLKVDKGYPLALFKYRRREISLETLIILNSLTNCFALWSRKLNDPVLWDNLKKLVVKYEPFFDYEPQKFKKLLADKVSEQSTDT